MCALPRNDMVFRQSCIKSRIRNRHFSLPLIRLLFLRTTHPPSERNYSSTRLLANQALRLLFPMLQLGHNGLHMSPHLLRRPVCRCHVVYAEVDELLRTGIVKLAALVAPFAVFLIQGAVYLPAENTVLQRHPAALAEQLPGRTQQGVDGNVIKPGQQLQGFRVGSCFAVLP